MSTDLDNMTAMELRRRVSRKDVSPVELTERALAKAERTQATLNAFFLIMPEAALAAARAAEDTVMRGQPLGLLHSQLAVARFAFEWSSARSGGGDFILGVFALVWAFADVLVHVRIPPLAVDP